MTTNLAKVTKELQENKEATDPLNTYRKKFGNLKDCVNVTGTNLIFHLNGTSFQFNHPTKIFEAYGAGVINEASWNRYQEGR